MPRTARRTYPSLRRWKTLPSCGAARVKWTNCPDIGPTPPIWNISHWRTVLRAAGSEGKKRPLFEYWAHEASLLPLAAQPLFGGVKRA